LQAQPLSWSIGAVPKTDDFGPFSRNATYQELTARAQLTRRTVSHQNWEW
jgi:hypothetical protein